MINWLKNSSLIKFLGTLIIICGIFWLTLSCTEAYFSGVFENSDNYFVAISQVLGGVLGGIFTLLGVWWTLIIQKKDREEDLIQSERRQLEQNRLQNLPVFQYETDNKNKSISGIVCMVNCNNIAEAVCVPLNIYVKNIGLGTAQHIYYQLIIDNKYQGFKQGNGNSLIKVNETIECNYYVYVRNQEESLSAKLVVYYDDLIGNHYIQELEGSLTKSCTIYSDTGKEEEKFELFFPNVKDYYIVENDYTYEIPQEVIDIHENNKKYYENIKRYSNLKNYNEINLLVQKFTLKYSKNLFDYLPSIYKKIKLMGSGGGIINIEENVKEVEYIVTLGCYTSQRFNCEFNYNVLLNVNLNSKRVCIDNIKLKRNSIKTNTLYHFISYIQFKLHMYFQKKKINKK